MGGKTALTACMVDGFGEFAEADYRRSWLMFDDVSYALPPQLRGPLDYPKDITERLEFSVTRAALDREGAEHVAQATRSDSQDATFLQLAERVPPSDADIAGGAVLSDQEACDVLGLQTPPTRAVALAFLLNKLLYLGQRDGLVPIVGKGHAGDMIAWKVRKAMQDRATSLPGRPASSAAARTSYAAFAAGLSFGFIDDADLVSAPLDALLRFKTTNRALLHRGQDHIEQVARRFGKLQDDPGFSVEVERLRQAAMEERHKLGDEARRGLLDAGIKIAGRALGAGASAFAGGVVLTMHPGPAAVAGAISVVTAALPDALGLLRKVRAARSPELAYLFRLNQRS